MNELNVRIQQLAPMRIAAVRAVGEHPELDAWRVLETWAGPRGFLGRIDEHPVFGFNNPSPSGQSKTYGYEFWMRVPAGTQSEGSIEVKDFLGGRYAVITHMGLPNPEIWKVLGEWVQASIYQWRDTHELEKPHDPLAPLERMLFDLYLPIEG